MRVDVWTDGACSGNPGPGGWGAILQWKDAEKEMCGFEPHTTNNRMELTAAVKALEALKKPCVVAIHTDSQYVQKGVTEWMTSWKKKGWRTASGKDVKNTDLWLSLDALIQQHDVSWLWVKGHADNALNIRADILARSAIR